MGWLNGKKTSLGIISLGVLAICFEMGLVDESMTKMIAAVLFSWTGVSARHAWAKGK